MIVPQEKDSTSKTLGKNPIDQSKPVLFPTENILKKKGDRYKTNIWVSRKIFSGFSDACHISGRKTCDVIEPMMEAYIKITKNKLLNKVDVCPFKAVEIKIGILNISQKYDKRGPKSKESSPETMRYMVKCPRSNFRLTPKNYCKSQCCYGGHHESKHNKDKVVCEIFVKLE